MLRSSNCEKRWEATRELWIVRASEVPECHCVNGPSKAHHFLDAAITVCGDNEILSRQVSSWRTHAHEDVMMELSLLVVAQ
jgi:hypothetical protein